MTNKLVPCYTIVRYRGASQRSYEMSYKIGYITTFVDGEKKITFFGFVQGQVVENMIIANLG